jgi:hypothetical protein
VTLSRGARGCKLTVPPGPEARGLCEQRGHAELVDLPTDAAREIYGSDPLVITGGAFRPTGQAVVVDGGYRVTGRWPLGSGCQHSVWIVGGCRIRDGDQPRLGADGLPVMRLLFFPAASCEILDT